MSLSSDPLSLIGKTLAGHFLVERFIGEGRFSHVYRGEHVGPKKPVALKCMKLGLALDATTADTFLKKFRDDNKTNSTVTKGQPSFVRSIGSGMTTSEAGIHVPYTVLEWLDGRSLAIDVKARRAQGGAGRSLSEAVALLTPAAVGIAHAHAQGVAHGDVSSGNLFITKANGAPDVKILDFGVAKLVYDLTQAIAPTKAPERIFSLPYGAPEHFDAKVGVPGLWTDVYGLAMIVLEVLRDRPIADGDRPDAFAPIALDAKVRPTPRQLGVRVGDDAERVLARAVAIAPKERWSDVGSFWAALKEAAQKEPRTSVKPAPSGPSLAQPSSPPPVSGPKSTRSPSSARAPSSSRVPVAAPAIAAQPVASPLVAPPPVAAAPVATAVTWTTPVSAQAALADRASPTPAPKDAATDGRPPSTVRMVRPGAQAPAAPAAAVGARSAAESRPPVKIGTTPPPSPAVGAPALADAKAARDAKVTTGDLARSPSQPASLNAPSSPPDAAKSPDSARRAVPPPPPMAAAPPRSTPASPPSPASPHPLTPAAGVAHLGAPPPPVQLAPPPMASAPPAPPHVQGPPPMASAPHMHGPPPPPHVQPMHHAPQGAPPMGPAQATPSPQAQHAQHGPSPTPPMASMPHGHPPPPPPAMQHAHVPAPPPMSQHHVPPPPPSMHHPPPAPPTSGGALPAPPQQIPIVHVIPAAAPPPPPPQVGIGDVSRTVKEMVPPPKTNIEVGNLPSVIVEDAEVPPSRAQDTVRVEVRSSAVPVSNPYLMSGAALQPVIPPTSPALAMSMGAPPPVLENPYGTSRPMPYRTRRERARTRLLWVAAISFVVVFAVGAAALGVHWYLGRNGAPPRSGEP